MGAAAVRGADLTLRVLRRRGATKERLKQAWTLREMQPCSAGKETKGKLLPRNKVGEGERMKMGRFEKLFVNRLGRGRRVAEHAEKMLRLVGFKPGQTYLDFGCGNGAAAVYLASKLGLDVTGIDVDPDQIEAAGTLSKETTRARFLTVDGTKLPFGDNEFDFVATHKVTHHIPDWHEALFQMLRVLRPNGYLLYTDFAFPTWVASFSKEIVKSMGFPTAGRFAKENHLVPAHRAQTFNTYEVVWQNTRSDSALEQDSAR